MNENTSTLQGILDITPPTAPWQYTWEIHAFEMTILSLVFIGFLALCLLLLWRQYFSRKGKARQQISSLRKQLRTQHINDKHAAFQLARILQESLNLTQLSPRTTLPESLQDHHQHWQQFTESLSVLRYADRAAAEQEVSRLIHDAYFWLRHWPKNA